MKKGWVVAGGLQKWSVLMLKRGAWKNGEWKREWKALSDGRVRAGGGGGDGSVLEEWKVASA